LSTKSIDRMVKEIDQMRRHKGKYYRRWLRNYTKWVKLEIANSQGCGRAATHWLRGMDNFIRYPRRKRGNS